MFPKNSPKYVTKLFLLIFHICVKVSCHFVGVSFFTRIWSGVILVHNIQENLFQAWAVNSKPSMLPVLHAIIGFPCPLLGHLNIISQEVIGRAWPLLSEVCVLIPSPHYILLVHILPCRPVMGHGWKCHTMMLCC